MSAQPIIYTGQVLDLVFKVTNQSKAIVNLATASAMRVDFRRNTGTPKTGVAALTTDGTDGKLQYTTLITDLDIAGVYTAQAFYTIGGIEYPTTAITFTVSIRGQHA